MRPDRAERATAHANGADDTEIAADGIERVSEPETTALYAVATQKVSGDWVTFNEFVDPKIANQVAAILRSFGAAVRVELIPTPIP